jgi:hypothetical protein
MNVVVVYVEDNYGEWPKCIHHISVTHKTEGVRNTGNLFVSLVRTTHQVQYFPM